MGNSKASKKHAGGNERVPQVRILVVDDHAIVRRGLKQILSEVPGMVVAGEAATGAAALNELRSADWDVVVLDISLPDRSGLDVLKQIKTLYPKLPVLVLSMHDEAQYAVRVLRAGAAGYLTKEGAPEELRSAMQKIAAGGRYVSNALAEKLAFEIGVDQERPPHERLSDREFEVMSMIAQGMRITDIAEKLCLSVKTISSHRARTLSKMKMKSNADLIRYVLNHNLT